MKNLKKYAEKSLPHLQVALRLCNLFLEDSSNLGDIVPFIFSDKNIDQSKTAYHPYELAALNEGTIQTLPDKDYYFLQQVLPIASRICYHLDGCVDFNYNYTNNRDFKIEPSAEEANSSKISSYDSHLVEYNSIMLHTLRRVDSRILDNFKCHNKYNHQHSKSQYPIENEISYAAKTSNLIALHVRESIKRFCGIKLKIVHEIMLDRKDLVFDSKYSNLETTLENSDGFISSGRVLSARANVYQELKEILNLLLNDEVKEILLEGSCASTCKTSELEKAFHKTVLMVQQYLSVLEFTFIDFSELDLIDNCPKR